VLVSEILAEQSKKEEENKIHFQTNEEELCSYINSVVSASLVLASSQTKVSLTSSVDKVPTTIQSIIKNWPSPSPAVSGLISSLFEGRENWALLLPDIQLVPNQYVVAAIQACVFGASAMQSNANDEYTNNVCRT